MKTLLSALLISVGLLALTSSVTLAASQGDNNGKPFQELQDAVDAAVAAETAAREAADAAEASAREAADSAEETARIAGDNAESAARAAEDAALSAAIAAEEAARIAADLALQAEIDAQAALLLDLDGRVSVLEGFHLDRSATWTETASTFDVTNIAGTIAGLNFQPGEWIAFISRNAATRREFGNCTNNPRVANWLNAAASGANYSSGFFSGSGSFFLSGGRWFNSPTLWLRTNATADPFLQIFGNTGWSHFVIDRRGNTSLINFEVFSFQSAGGYGIGNTLTLNVASTRQDACGF